MSPIFSRVCNTHIYSYSSTYIIIHTPYFKDRIYKNMSPPNHLTPSLPSPLLYSCSFLFYEATFWPLAGAHRGTSELQAEWSRWKYQNQPFTCFPFNISNVFPSKEYLLKKIEWVCSHHSWQRIKFKVSSYCSFIACFLPVSVPNFPEALEVGLEPLVTATEQGWKGVKWETAPLWTSVSGSNPLWS